MSDKNRDAFIALWKDGGSLCDDDMIKYWNEAAGMAKPFDTAIAELQTAFIGECMAIDDMYNKLKKLYKRKGKRRVRVGKSAIVQMPKCLLQKP